MAHSSPISQSIKELEAALAYKKQQEITQTTLNKLFDIKSKFQGKCFSSNTITKRCASTYFSLIHYVNFYMNEENNIFVEEKSIYVHNNRYTPKTWGVNSKFSLDCSWKTKQLTSSGKELSSFGSIYPAYNDFRYPVSLSCFNHLWNSSLEAHITFKQAFKSMISIPQTENISQADAISEETISNSLSRLNIPTIDLKEYPEMYELLNTSDLPFLSNGRWLPLSLAKSILTDYCNQLQRQINDGYAPHYISYLKRKRDTIQSFIDTYLFKLLQ